MTTTTAQDFLFQQIKELLPSESSMMDTVSELLSVSNDSAYRRIRGETPLILEEAKILCAHFEISLDQLLKVEKGTTLFQHIRVDTHNYQYEKYLQDLIKKLRYTNSFTNKELIYRTKDIPLFHNFYFQPLIAFRYFFWMKSVIRHPDFIDKEFELNCVSPEITMLSKELLTEYNKMPSTEIWNTECINAAITQIEFYKDSGYFAATADIKTIYDSLEETFVHLKNMVECGNKYMPGENPDIQKSNFNFFYNRAMLGDNAVLIKTDHIKTAFINYDGLNYLQSTDKSFCDPLYERFEATNEKGYYH